MPTTEFLPLDASALLAELEQEKQQLMALREELQRSKPICSYFE